MASMARPMCANGSAAERSAGASAGDRDVGELHGGRNGARSGWASSRYVMAAAIPSFLPAAIAVRCGITDVMSHVGCVEACDHAGALRPGFTAKTILPSDDGEVSGE
jgi:hypothetical protein